MQTTDLTMLWIIDYLLFIKEVKSQAEFCRKINMVNSTVAKIRNGAAHFTAEHIETACHVFGINANFIVGVEKKVFLKQNSIENTDFISVKASIK